MTPLSVCPSVLLMSSTTPLFLFFFSLVKTFPSEGVTLSTEKLLVKSLLTNYAKVGIVGRPVANTSETLNVHFGLSLIQILSLNEKEQVLTTNMWGTYKWRDQLLSWDPKKYGGVERARIPTENIWMPDIVLYNYADTRLSEIRPTLAVVDYNGSVLWVPTAIYKSSCQISIKYFPFDVQKCYLKFGSWTYDGNKLNIHFVDNKTELDLTDFMESNEWEVTKHHGERKERFYPCCAEPYPALTFHVTLKRKGGFFHYILVLPCVLLSILTLVIFWIPPESPAKMQLGMNIYVAFFMLLLLLAESTPKGADSVPLLCAYFVLNMILITLSTFLAVIVVNLYVRGEKKNRAPYWLRMITIEGFGRLLCMTGELGLMDGPDKVRKNTKARRESNMKPKMRSNAAHVKKDEEAPLTSVVNHGGPSLGVTNHNNHVSSPATPASTHEPSPLPVHRSLEAEVREIRRQVRAYVQRLDEGDERSRIVSEWRQCAIVMDRFFFVLYITTNVLSLASIFPQMMTAEDPTGHAS